MCRRPLAGFFSRMCTGTPMASPNCPAAAQTRQCGCHCSSQTERPCCLCPVSGHALRAVQPASESACSFLFIQSFCSCRPSSPTSKRFFAREHGARAYSVLAWHLAWLVKLGLTAALTQGALLHALLLLPRPAAPRRHGLPRRRLRHRRDGLRRLRGRHAHHHTHARARI